VNQKQFIRDYYWVILFLFFSALSSVFGFVPGQMVYKNYWGFILELASFLPVMFILVGLFDVWIPKEKIEKHVGHGSGIIGAFWVTLLAMLQAGPLYGSFPIAYILRKKGASVRNIFIYLGAFSAIKLPMLTFEIGFMGFKFSLLRTLISLPVFYVIGVLMEKILSKDFQVMDGR
jgi:uncharacterized membrane protein YraQ (UPF0718 family)